MLSSQRLRYEVFVEELGATGDTVDHENRLEADEFDPWFEHLVLIDNSRDISSLEHVVGVYRILNGKVAANECGFYSGSEYDLTRLIQTGRPLLELGRSCVHRDFRGGSAMFMLWNGVADYVLENEIEIMFGVASFHGTDLNSNARQLSFLHCDYLAPEDIRVAARNEGYASMARIPCDRIDKETAMKEMPALIRAYLKLGGFVGDGAFIDWDFNTTDVCLLMDTSRMSQQRRRRYIQYRGKG